MTEIFLKRWKIGNFRVYAGADKNLGWKKPTFFFQLYGKDRDKIRGFEFSASWLGYGVHSSAIEYLRS